jgi:RNA polymerase sigma-70 factor (ECF subfamily)
MRGQPSDHTLQATALVNEAYVRLVDVQEMNWRNRAHFLAMAARLMRRILVDSARARRAHKRGGDAIKVSFSEDLAVTDSKGPDMLCLDDALHALADVTRWRCAAMHVTCGSLSCLRLISESIRPLLS